MSVEPEPYGALLYSALREISGYDVITGILDYDAIQQLKVADRDTTMKLFRKSSDEVIQSIKMNNPKEAAAILVRNAKESAAKAANPGDGLEMAGLWVLLSCLD